MTTLTTISVTGMTCEHCVSAVTRELKAVDGVNRVTVELRNGGTSSVSVHSSAPLEEAALREAIDEAGYDIVGLDVLEDALAAQMTERADQYRATGVRHAHGDGHAHGESGQAHARGESGCGCGGHGNGGGHGHGGGRGSGGCGCGGHGEQAGTVALAEQAAETPAEQAPAEQASHGGCGCGCGGQGRQGLGIGLPIVPLN